MADQSEFQGGIAGITLDCRRAAPLARFWAAALGWKVRPCDQAPFEELLSLGASVVSRQDRWVVLADPEGNEFCVMNPPVELADG
ncbi:VOC family protein [Actinopolymorpha alba]|uniref:VOC family protein n=1 Tax=Actinopolymorpha alba TaxID=533267 RepID=UPI000379F622|nr:VOC family protein [Actinopolymorpha alba]